MPYWEDATWQQSLTEAIHNNVVYPQPLSGDTLPTGEGAVEFDYSDGKLININLVQSTGHRNLDEAIIQGIEKTTPPKAIFQGNIAHHFSVPLVMEPDVDQLRMNIYDAIAHAMTLPKGVFANNPQFVYINANYLNGNLEDITAQGPGSSDPLPSAIVSRLGTAAMPLAPSNFKDKSVDLSVHFCVALQYQQCFSNSSNSREHWVNINGGLLRVGKKADDWSNGAGLSYVVTPDAGVPLNAAQMAMLYHDAAEHGDSAAQVNLAESYEKGSGVTQDYAAAIDWYRKAAYQGNLVAQDALLTMYLHGEGVPSDNTDALLWFQKLAEQGLPDAELFLGFCYHFQKLGIANPDYALAMSWYKKAADQGYVAAQYRVGVLYYQGRGVPQDFATAASWYQKAADKDYLSALNDLGLMYMDGKGVARDYAKAARLLRGGEDQGLSYSICSLINMQALGVVSPLSDQEAALWASHLENDASCANQVAWVLATNSNAGVRRPTRALQLAQSALSKSPHDWRIMDTAAAAYAATGDFGKAVDIERSAFQLMTSQDSDAVEQTGMRARLTLYQSGKPYLSGDTED